MAITFGQFGVNNVDFHISTPESHYSWNDNFYYTIYYIFASPKFFGKTGNYIGIGCVRISSPNSEAKKAESLWRYIKKDLMYTELPKNCVTVSYDTAFYKFLITHLTYKERLDFIQAFHLCLGYDDFYKSLGDDLGCFSSALIRGYNTIEEFESEMALYRKYLYQEDRILTEDDLKTSAFHVQQNYAKSAEEMLAFFQSQKSVCFFTYDDMLHNSRLKLDRGSECKCHEYVKNHRGEWILSGYWNEYNHQITFDGEAILATQPDLLLKYLEQVAAIPLKGRVMLYNGYGETMDILFPLKDYRTIKESEITNLIAENKRLNKSILELDSLKQNILDLQKEVEAKKEELRIANEKLSKIKAFVEC